MVSLSGCVWELGEVVKLICLPRQRGIAAVARAPVGKRATLHLTKVMQFLQ